MINIDLLRKNPDLFKRTLKYRGIDAGIVDKILVEDKLWKEIKNREEHLRSERNRISKEIADRKKAGKDVSELKKRAAEIANDVKKMAEEREDVEKRRYTLLLQIPNLLDGDTPIGKDENDNVEIRKWGKINKHSHDILSHYDWGKRTGLIDFESGVRLGGHRFTVLRGEIARLERALINFMLNLHVSNGYEEFATPHLVRTGIILGTGQLPKFEEDLYKLRDDDLWLIPTAEVTLVGMFAGMILDEKDLPLRVTAYTPCYRREAGAYGKDIKGMIRQHQFDKVELVHIVMPDENKEELERITREAEIVLKQLELPYRVVSLCSGDIGFAAAKTYDIEVWMPSQDKYREISSCSTCTDFQARRSNIRYRHKGRLEFPYTLNGSGLAVGRTLVAIIENYQDEDGGIVIPKVLRDYLGTDYIEGKPNQRT